MAAASDGERNVIYLSSPGGLATSIGQGAVHTLNGISGSGDLFGSGVYRLTSRLQDRYWIYLPLIIR